MKKLRFLLLIFAAILVAQVSNAQTNNRVVFDEWVVPVENDWVYCLDENVTGTLVYQVKYKFDKDGNLVKLFFQNKGTLLIGETTGNTYKLIDNFREFYGVAPKEGEYMLTGIFKIISLGEGITYDGRVQVHIDVDKFGNIVEKKFIWDLCF
jgi:hypothetical protein